MHVIALTILTHFQGKVKDVWITNLNQEKTFA